MSFQKFIIIVAVAPIIVFLVFILTWRGVISRKSVQEIKALPDNTGANSFDVIDNSLQTTTIKVKVAAYNKVAGRMVATLIVILFLFHPTLTSTTLSVFK